MPDTPSIERDAEVRRQLAVAVPRTQFEAAWAAYEEASIAGLCHEGAWEVALGRAHNSTSTAASNPRTR